MNLSSTVPSPQNYKFTSIAAFFSILFFISGPVIAQAQKSSYQTDLKAFEGYYQFSQNKDAYLQITVKGKQLMLTQLCDLKELLFDQKSELDFYNTQNDLRRDPVSQRLGCTS